MRVEGMGDLCFPSILGMGLSSYEWGNEGQTLMVPQPMSRLVIFGIKGDGQGLMELFTRAQ